MDKLETALNYMTLKQKEVHDLKLRGLTQKEIGYILGISQPAVFYHYHLGIKRAKKLASFFKKYL
jgi:predicted transcriptional regulator